MFTCRVAPAEAAPDQRERKDLVIVRPVIFGREADADAHLQPVAIEHPGIDWAGRIGIGSRLGRGGSCSERARDKSGGKK